MKAEIVSSSFRDPSGFLFWQNGSIYRNVHHSFQSHYDCLMSSGLYTELVDAGLLIPHEEVEADSAYAFRAYKVLKPEMVTDISYPYEWSFSQLKDAALTTLDIQKRALSHDMILKDASAYNIQFVKGKPVLIDTLSFEKYVEGYPWVAYKQFCQHFLAPVALMSTKDVRLSQLLRIYIDGVPVDLASSLLPWRTRFSFSLLLHIHLHAKSQKRYSDDVISKSRFVPKVSRQSLLGLIDSLESSIGAMKWQPKGTEWADYYRDDSYVPEALEDKKRLVKNYLDMADPKTVWDFGGNTGLHSRLASVRGAQTVSFDIDPACVELNYLQVKRDGEEKILPLLLDLTNPSPDIGWANDERMSVVRRGPVDAAMALALIHHLAISNNVPIGKIARYFASTCRWLIIEFVPKSDAKVKKLLATREDIFPDYTQESFERDFGEVFSVRASNRILKSERTLYLMEVK